MKRLLFILLTALPLCSCGSSDEPSDPLALQSESSKNFESLELEEKIQFIKSNQEIEIEIAELDGKAPTAIAELPSHYLKAVEKLLIALDKHRDKLNQENPKIKVVRLGNERRVMATNSDLAVEIKLGIPSDSSTSIESILAYLTEDARKEFFLMQSLQEMVGPELKFPNNLNLTCLDRAEGIFKNSLLELEKLKTTKKWKLKEFWLLADDQHCGGYPQGRVTIKLEPSLFKIRFVPGPNTGESSEHIKATWTFIDWLQRIETGIHTNTKDADSFLLETSDYTSLQSLEAILIFLSNNQNRVAALASRGLRKINFQESSTTRPLGVRVTKSDAAARVETTELEISLTHDDEATQLMDLLIVRDTLESELHSTSQELSRHQEFVEKLQHEIQNHYEELRRLSRVYIENLRAQFLSMNYQIQVAYEDFYDQPMLAFTLALRISQYREELLLLFQMMKNAGHPPKISFGVWFHPELNPDHFFITIEPDWAEQMEAMKKRLSAPEATLQSTEERSVTSP